jgi:hypothetical protein
MHASIHRELHTTHSMVVVCSSVNLHGRDTDEAGDKPSALDRIHVWCMLLKGGVGIGCQYMSITIVRPLDVSHVRVVV